MKKIKNIIILFIIIILGSLINTKSYAETQMNIVTDKKEIQQDEELNIKVEIKNAQVAAFTLEIFTRSR